MQRKMLLISNQGGATNNIKSIFEDCFKVQVCRIDSKVVASMMGIFKPDFIFINFLSQGEFDAILETLHYNYWNTPFVGIGKIDDYFKYDSYTRGTNNEIFYDCNIDLDLVKQCCYKLGIDYSVALTDNQAAASYKPTVLLIDDSPIFLRQGKNMLEDDYTVLVAPSMDKAYKILSEHEVNLILLDYEMPLVDGRQAFIQLKENEKHKNIPVIFLTGVSDRLHIEEVLKLRPAGYILKPVTKEELIKRVSVVLG